MSDRPEISLAAWQRMSAPRSRPLGQGDRAMVATPLAPMIGRKRELATLRRHLRDPTARLITLTGPAGVGKTRLVRAVAAKPPAAFSHGVRFISLEAITAVDLVLPTIARSFGLREVEPESAAARLRTALGERRLLLILDNFEQVVDAAPALAALLVTCPGVTALVTSRVPLGVPGEQEFPVPPLALPAAGSLPPIAELARGEAVALFLRRARAASPDFALTEANAPAVTALCQRLDGLPLAIELVAAQVKVLPPAALLARLERRLPLPRGVVAPASPRHRTMHEAIGWSYDLLAAPHQALFRRLSVFVGGCTLEAAEAVGKEQGDEDHDSPLARGPAVPDRDGAPRSPSVLDGIATLIDWNLVRLEEESAGNPRFRMLETIRRFGREQLETSDEATVVHRRHANWSVDLAEEYGQRAIGADIVGLRGLEAEHANFLSALAWLTQAGETTTALRLAGGLNWYWFLHSYLDEGRDRLETALVAAATAPAPLRARALSGLSMLALVQRDFGRAHAALNEALGLARAAADVPGVALARALQGYLALFEGDPGAANALGKESLALHEELAHWGGVDLCRFLLAKAAHYRDDLGPAAEFYEQLLASSRERGNDYYVGESLRGLGMLAQIAGNDAGALVYYRDALSWLREVGEWWNVAACLENLASLSAGLGRPEWGARLFGAAETVRSAVAATRFPPDQPAYDRAVTAVRAAMGEPAFAAAWATGAAMTREEAFTEALVRTELAAPVASSPAVAGHDTLADSAALVALSAREREVLRLIAAGKTDPEIAAILFVGRRTAEWHTRNVLRKLGAATRAEAAARATRIGFA